MRQGLRYGPNMKKAMLVTKYLMKNLLSATVFVALTLTAVIWLTQSLRLLELVANSDAPPSLFIKLVALSLPRFLEIILPLSLVAAIMFVYNRMIMDNELIVLRACGVDQYAMARPALLLAGGVTAVVLLMTTWLSPVSFAEMQHLRQVVKAQYSSFLLREGVFNTFGKDLTVYLRKRNAGGELLGLMIHDTRDKNSPPITTTAKSGRIFLENDIPVIRVYDGMRQQMDSASNVTSKLTFKSYEIQITGLDNSPRARKRDANERTLFELLNPDLQDRWERQSADTMKAEAIARIVTPFNAIGFTLAALTALLLGPFNRRGQSKKLFAAAIIVIALEVANLVVASAAKKHFPLSALLPALTFGPIIFCLYAMHYKGEQRLMLLLRRWQSRWREEAVA